MNVIMDTQNKELIVRKRMSAFLEKALRFCGYDFRHDDFKQIVYGEKECNTPFEYCFKSMYDAYDYLLANSKNSLSSEILRKFFYIIDGAESDEYFVECIKNKFFCMLDSPPIEKAVDFHLYVYSELKDKDENIRLIVSLMFFNYVLLKSGIPILRFIRPVLKEYVDCRSAYFEGDRERIFKLFLNQIREAKIQDKTYYKNLRPLTVAEICNRIYRDKDTLQNVYGIESIAIYGSFSKGIQRIDSDIDLLVVFSQDLPCESKQRTAENVESHYFNVFNRYIDITEVREFVSDWLIKEITNYKKIF